MPLGDAANLRGTPEPVRFHNLYDAAHAVALAGLKLAGYRDIPDSLVETLGAAIEEGLREIEIRLKRLG